MAEENDYCPPHCCCDCEICCDCKQPKPPKRRGKVIATPCNGFGSPMSQYSVEYDGDDQPPSDDIIGECVGEAVRKAWAAGHDPALPPFLVIVSFA